MNKIKYKDDCQDNQFFIIENIFRILSKINLFE